MKLKKPLRETLCKSAQQRNHVKYFILEKAKIFGAVIIVAILSITMIAVFAGCRKGDDGDDGGIIDTVKLSFGSAIIEVVQEISTQGGEIVIDDEYSAIDGLTITVPEYSYNMPIDYVIKTYPVNSHKFGDGFNILSPLIEIDNGHQFSNEIIEVEIPVTLSENSNPMGFYYDVTDESLEPVPIIEVKQNSIVLGVKHFSKLIISDISLSTIQSLTSASSIADSGFTPGLDDWHYTNYGSAVSQGGHCAGQSLTMSWYYSEKYKKESEPRLFGRFDNNEESDTPLFWQDDNNAYRFSSVIQESIDFSADEWIDFIMYCTDNPEKTFYAFAYAINITGTPQLMAIFPDTGSGHAVVAYKVVGNKIYVADPNYPGQTDRYVEYNPVAKSFYSYSSGANAADIATNGATAYTKIVYAAKSALVDYAAIENNYNKIFDGTIGDNIFPDTVVEVMTDYTQAVYQKIDRTITLGTEYKETLSEDFDDCVGIKITPEYASMVYSLYINDTLVEEPDVVAYNGSLYYVITLQEGANEFGFLAEYEVDYSGNYFYYYIDYIRLSVIFTDDITQSAIIFESKGGTAISNLVENAGESITAPDDPVKTGYDFGGWYLDWDCTVAYVFSVMPNSDIVVYAKWIEKNLIDKIDGVFYLYTINDSKNIDPIEYQYYEITDDGTYVEVFKSKDSDEVITNGTWTLTGDIITFDNGNEGIYEAIADGEYLYDLPQENPYFIYKRKIDVTIAVSINFESNGGSAVPSITQNTGTDVVPPNPPVKNNHTFMGWYSDRDLTVIYSFDKMPYKDIKLYAKWVEGVPSKVNVACAFHSNYSYSPHIYTEEYDIGAPFPYEFLDDWYYGIFGHKFSGYFIDQNCTIPLEYTTVPDHDVAVYIKWTKITLSEALGKYRKINMANLDHVEYMFIEFFSNGTCMETYKLWSSSTEVETGGVYTIRDSNGLIFDVDMDSDPFPDSYLIYEGQVHSSRSGDWEKIE